MANFEASIQVKVIDEATREINRIEKEIDELAKKSQFALGGGKSGARIRKEQLEQRKRELEIERGLAQTEKNRLNLADEVVKLTAKELSLNRQLSRERFRQLDAAKEAATRSRNNRAQNAALGVGFPLLFGGGAGSIIGGGLGAAGGFGGSVIGSAIGAQFDQIVSSAAELGQALNPLTADLDRVTEAAGLAGTEAAGLVSDIEEVSGEFAALRAATELLADRIGDDGVDQLRKFGDSATDFGNLLSLAFTNISTSIAKNLNPALDELLRRLENASLQGIGERLVREGGPDADRIVAAGAGGGLEALERQRDVIRDILREREEALRDNAPTESIEEQLRVEKELLDALKERARVQKEIERAEEKAAAAAKRKAEQDARAAAREAERARKLEERVQKQIQADLLSAASSQEQQRLDNLESQARIERDKFALIEIQRDRELLQLATARQKALIGITDARRQASIAADFEAREDRVRNNADNSAAELVTTNARAAEDQLRVLTNQLQLTQALTDEEKRRVQLQQDLATLDRNDAGLADGDVERLKEATIALSEGEAAAERYNQVLSQTEEIAGALSNNVLNGIRAVVEGTATAEEAFASFLDTIVDLLLKAAAEQIAAYIAIGIAKQFAGMGGGISTGSFDANKISSSNTAVAFGNDSFLAEGGRTMGNMPYVVGEKGAELFVPGKTGTMVPADVFEATRQAIAGNGPEGGNSDAFEQNSVALGNSSAITKENSLVREMGMRENEPIDVRYESTVINNVSYVSEEQFQKGLKSAVAQSKASVFGDLKNKPSARAGIGLR